MAWCSPGTTAGRGSAGRIQRTGRWCARGRAAGRAGGCVVTAIVTRRHSGSLLALARRHPAEVAVLEPVGIALEGDDLGMMHEPVDHRGGHDLVAEHLAPPAEGLIAGHDP